ncbi:MAG: glycosyltransferase [Candidatus Competibacterales bacterium]
MAALGVLHVVEHWRPVLDGNATRSLALVEALAADPRLAPRVLVSSRQFQRTRGDLTDDLDGRVAAVAPSRREHRRRRWQKSFVDAGHLGRAVKAAVDAAGSQLIHCHCSSTVGSATLKAARELDLPAVAEVRYDLAGAVMTETVGFALPGLETALRHWFERHLAGADALVAASHSLATLVARHVPTAAERLTVVPNGTDPQRFTPGPKDPQSLRRWGLEGALVVGTTSNMLRHEGLDRLLQTAAVLKGQLPTLKLLFVGSGPQHQALEAQARALGVDAVFTGRLPPAAIPDYLRLMDIFVVPRRDASVTRHAGPVKLMEAMACGRAALGTAVGDIPALLAEGRGAVVPATASNAHLAEALAALLRDPEERRRLGQRARAWVETQTWAKAAARYHEAYHRALDHHRRRRR